MPAKNILRSSDIREMSAADVAAKIAELEEERFRLNFRSATEPLEDPLRLRWIRKDIARLKTILRERTIETGALARGK
jgi:large subunit ribosomal protein L29